MPDIESLDELIKQIYNRCRIYFILRRLAGVKDAEELYPTLLEDLAEDAEEIVLSYCVTEVECPNE